MSSSEGLWHSLQPEALDDIAQWQTAQKTAQIQRTAAVPTLLQEPAPHSLRGRSGSDGRLKTTN